MIIYQVLPHRAFPYIISSLVGVDETSKNDLQFDKTIKYFRRSFQFSEIFHLNYLKELERMYAYQTQVIRFHPDKKLPRKFSEIYQERYLEYIYFDNRFPSNTYLSEEEQQQEIPFLYGLFSSERLLDFKKETDFSFTFIDNPVDSVYNLYRYTKFVYSSGFDEFKYSYYGDPDLIGDIDYQGRNYVHYYELFERNDTMEKFIDSFINAECKWVHKFFYFPITIYEEGSGRLSKLYKNHNFYGLVNTKNNLIKSIEKLNNFPIFKRNNFTMDVNLFKSYFESDKPQDNTYRRKDLEYLMKDDLNFLQEKEKELNAN